MKLRLLLLFSFLFAGRLWADLPPTPMPFIPMFAKTYGVAAGAQITTHDTVSANSALCDKPGTSYLLVVSNGSAAGSEKVASATVSVNGTVVAGPAIQGPDAATRVYVMLGASNSIDVTLHGDASAAGNVHVELRREPVSSTSTVQTWSTAASTHQSYEMRFDANTLMTELGQESPSATLVVTRNAGMQAADAFTVTLNGTVVMTKADFSSGSQRAAKPVTLQFTDNLLHVDVTTGTVASVVTANVVEQSGNSTPSLVMNDMPLVTTTSPFTFRGNVGDDMGCTSLTVNGTALPFDANDGSFSVSLPLTKGMNTPTFVLYNCAGNGSQVQPTLLYDVDAPVVTITSPAPSAFVASTTLTVTGTATDDSGLAPRVKVNGVSATVAAFNHAWTASVTLPAGDGAKTLTIVATDAAGHTTTLTNSITLDTTKPVITANVSPAANAAGWNSTPVSLSFTCSDPGGAVTTCSGPVTLSADGAGQHVVGHVVDRAGNEVTIDQVINIDQTRPEINAFRLPAPNHNQWNNTSVVVQPVCSDAVSGIATCAGDGGNVTIDGANQTFSTTAVDRAGNTTTITNAVNIDRTPPLVTIDPLPAYTSDTTVTIAGNATDTLSGIDVVTASGYDAQRSGDRFTGTVPLRHGDNVITVAATDRAGNHVEAPAVHIRLDTAPPSLTIDSPADGSSSTDGSITITGHASDDDTLASVTVSGQAASVAADGTFHLAVALVDGVNELVVAATDAVGKVTQRSVHVTHFLLPSIAITEPHDLAVVRNATTTVNGSTGPETVAVTVNGVAATVSNGQFSAANVPLAQGRTVVTANAATASGRTATSSINVYRDSIPPRLLVNSPQDGATVYASPITISGMVDDIVVGTINSRQMRVTVNGRDATVSNRAFYLGDVVLAEGVNTLLITAIDEGGNSTVLSYHVTLATPTLPHLSIVSGNGQSAVIGSTLPLPLVVKAAAADESPIAGASLTFEIAENSGTLTASNGAARSVSVLTGTDGQASVQWTLGMRAGAGNDRVRVTAPNVSAPVEFTAVDMVAPAHAIVVDSGNDQFGIIDAPLPRPLVAVVVDAGNNRVANVPVTFTTRSGSGSFNGQPSITVNSDSDGRVIVEPRLGPQPGEDNNVFVATLSAEAAPAVFKASGRAGGLAAETRISGVVLDNTTVPLAGVSVRIEGTNIVTQTNAQGQFMIAGAPVGYVKLFVDGSTAARSGTWPTLEYALYTLPGVDNSVGMPIYLVQIDNSHTLFVDDTTGGTLTVPELPGFALKVAPGSVTFPGGGRTGNLSATLVHADRIPMAPGFGQQPKFIVTIQPPGAHFDPPAQLSFPNVDGLKPGAVTEMYSFDHDLGQFVAIGTGSVSADGSVITSDPGVGVIKGGWHCGGNPSSTGTSAHCTECQKCKGDGCAPDEDKTGHPCKDDGDPSTFDFCYGGTCEHIRAAADLQIVHPATGPLGDAYEESPGGFVAYGAKGSVPETYVIVHGLSPQIEGARYRIAMNTPHLSGSLSSGSMGDFDANVDNTLSLTSTGLSTSPAEEAIELHLVAKDKDTLVDTVRLTVVYHSYEAALRVFIPYQFVGIPVPPGYTVFEPVDVPGPAPIAPIPTVSEYKGVVAHGDDRDFSPDPNASYRVSQTVTVHPYEDLDREHLSIPRNLAGKTIHYDRQTSLTEPDAEVSSSTARIKDVALAEPVDDAHKGAPYMVDFGRAPTEKMRIVSVTRNNQQSSFGMEGSAAEPIMWFAAAIDWGLTVHLDVQNPSHRVASVTGWQDGFPAYELWIRPEGTDEWTQAYGFKPPPGRTVMALFPLLANETVSSSVVIP